MTEEQIIDEVMNAAIDELPEPEKSGVGIFLKNGGMALDQREEDRKKAETFLAGMQWQPNN